MAPSSALRGTGRRYRIMKPVEPDGASIAELAADLLGEPATAVKTHRSGGNSRLYRIETGDGVFALKLYPYSKNDPRDRVGQEFRALKFLRSCGLTNVPEAIAWDVGRRVALYEWIAGDPVNAKGTAGAAEVDEMLAFATQLAKLRDRPDAAVLAPASAHCFSARAVLQQFEARLGPLERAASEEPALRCFLEDELRPLFPALAKRLAILYEKAGLALDAEIGADSLTLSPSDFGFHNMLRRGSDVMFIDFEYFGWDDPVKMIADVIWHPGSAMQPALAIRFRDAALAYFTGAGDTAVASRFNALFPLFGMIWCQIVLNVFRTDRGDNVDAAVSQPHRDAQLARARGILERVRAAGD